MRLIQLFLPLYDNDGRSLPAGLFRRVSEELTAAFGGLTAYSRAPARGLWKESGRRVRRDDILIYEVLTPRLDRAWWRAYKKRLAARFRQKEILLRAQTVETL